MKWKTFWQIVLLMSIAGVIAYGISYKNEFRIDGQNITNWDIVYLGSNTPNAMLINKKTGETYTYVAMANGWLKTVKKNNEDR